MQQQITNEQIQRAFQYWKMGTFKQCHLERQIVPLLADNLRPFKIPHEGWLRRCREAQMLTLEQVAHKLEVGRTAYFDLEMREESGSISLKKMAGAAAAMDCELIVGLRPISGQLFSEEIWRKLLKESVHDHWVRSRPQHLKVQALLAVVKRKMVDSDFRLRHRWSQRKSVK